MSENVKQSKLNILTNGLVKENPSLRLVLGTCPTLAVTTLAVNGVGMGLAATFVLICSNIVISALRKVIPDKVRLPAFITIIATFVTILQMLVKAFLPSLDTALGIYLPLIVVNCIILGRAEMFASKHGVFESALDGLGMGLGFTLTLVLMGTVRELLGAGSIFGIHVMPANVDPITVFIDVYKRQMKSMTTDGTNLLLARRSGEARRALWLTLAVNEQLTDGVRPRDLPADWFRLGPPAPEDDPLVAGVKSLVPMRCLLYTSRCV